MTYRIYRTEDIALKRNANDREFLKHRLYWMLYEGAQRLEDEVIGEYDNIFDAVDDLKKYAKIEIHEMPEGCIRIVGAYLVEYNGDDDCDDPEEISAPIAIAD